MGPFRKHLSGVCDQYPVQQWSKPSRRPKPPRMAQCAKTAKNAKAGVKEGNHIAHPYLINLASRRRLSEMRRSILEGFMPEPSSPATSVGSVTSMRLVLF